MAKRKLLNKLIHKDSISEILTLIKETEDEYITPSGNVYTHYGNDMFYHKSTFINKDNGYLYVNIKIGSKIVQRRVHRLVAETYIPNPNNYPIVMHIDNNKANADISNLKWGTIQENTLDACRDELLKNDKGFDDSQSMPVIKFDLLKNILNVYGSVSEAFKDTGITKSGILYQCNHKIKTKPRCGYYFRFYDEYNEKGFVI